ncbi:proton-conducting transporter membrane subunit [Truepera radiovictrix]|uniref:NADH/Ubiquinone/plastoquinone (Complex I) n=1 Tax=Truepera radiovictrix (strain DSM 17093 / CIP 108686 / LMG 22925 / RQ-24) TaxID=649638 RepID=D7CQ19_TRURR|nr:proton-conducting transporter membrane subunit [Truepera radiovictrix]ADI14803.1 NADH/Ubiquinone/plastoquinone (complex I) [Truepera radiovictrix DSM 17093]WMT56646.1 proton-conducting transporter membrane subunit [Truepera radiovictrix]
MNADPFMPLFVLLSSLVPSLVIFGLSDRQAGLRRWLYLGAEVVKLLLVVVMAERAAAGAVYEFSVPLLPGAELVLRAGPLALLFLVLSAGLWLLTTIYANGYMAGTPHQSRFYGFFGLCVTATAGVAMAGNLLTFFFFYELLTLVTYPLVVHTQSEAALRAGRTYLRYAIAGGTALLAGVIWLYVLAGAVPFTEGGALAAAGLGEQRAALTAIFVLLILGLGVKSALVPLHGWLPAAMVAPAPVSALLHAVAVVKAGAFGVLRVVYEVFGVSLAQELGVLGPLAVAAAITILYGSWMALQQDELKKRLAYSTVSQLAYITLGVSIAGAEATAGGIVHLVHHGVMKITLFFCAGVIAKTLGLTRISELDGVARRLPATMVAFSVAALGMMGLPPLAGFVTKWYLGLGAAENGELWPLAVLVLSTVLNAAYFLPIIYRAWFKAPPGPFTEKLPPSRFETRWVLLLPPLVTASLTVLVGLLATTELGALQWVSVIAERELPYAPEDIIP